MTKEDVNLKAKMKLEELKNQRTGKAMSITVNVSKDPTVNFQMLYKEMMQICNMHRTNVDEMFLLGAHMQLMSGNMRAQQMMQPKPIMTPEQKEAMKRQVENAQGKVRVKPSDV